MARSKQAEILFLAEMVRPDAAGVSNAVQKNTLPLSCCFPVPKTYEAAEEGCPAFTGAARPSPEASREGVTGTGAPSPISSSWRCPARG